VGYWDLNLTYMVTQLKFST